LQDRNGYFVHSNYEPLQEARRGLDTFVIEKENLFLFGLGLAYHLEVLLEKSSSLKKIFIWEPLEGSLQFEEVKKNFFI
jgi:hypothetical protein